jgi:hypothetical protein
MDMNANVTSNTPVPTEADLRRQGFTTEQIQRFISLRERYPLNEFVIGRKEINRLAFLRWYYRSGRVAS